MRALDGERLWLSLHFVNNFERLKWDPASAARVQADGPVGVSYDDLRDHLALTHDVIPFGFDWRRPMEDEAGRLAALIHSRTSGGVLARRSLLASQRRLP